MKKFKFYLLLMIVLSVISFAQSGGGFIIAKSTVDNGGGRSTGVDFIVSGTVGQVDATKELIGGDFNLTGGFWAQKTIPLADGMFKDGFEE